MLCLLVGYTGGVYMPVCVIGTPSVKYTSKSFPCAREFKDFCFNGGTCYHDKENHKTYCM